MRAPVDAARIETFLVALGAATREPARVYLVGGATAVLHGWRASTTDIDLGFEPDADELYRAIAQLKDQLDINLELATPAHFMPEVPGWRDRSVFIGDYGRLSVYHYDFVAQALAKLERAHVQDLADVASMVDRGLVDRTALHVALEGIRPLLYRFVAVDAEMLAARIDALR